MTVIVVDTNILRDCPRLDNSTWTSMLGHAQDWGVRIVVPEVVFMETVNQVRRLWRRDRDRLAELRLGHFRLTETQATMVAAIDRESDGYEDWLKARLDELKTFAGTRLRRSTLAILRVSDAAVSKTSNSNRGCRTSC